MGRKKGKQSSGFHSKAARAEFLRSSMCASAPIEEQHIVKPEQPLGSSSRPVLRLDALSSLRAFLTSPSTPLASASTPTPQPLTRLGVPATPPPLLRVDALIIEPPETLAELCVDTVARSLLRYDITALEGKPFSFFPGPLVSRLSTVASQHQQLVDENVEVVFTDSVEALTLHGPLTARALSALFPTVNMPNICNSSWSLDETPEASGNSPASAVVVSGFAAGFAAGTTHLVADCWEDSVDIPAVLGVKGCSHLHSLDLSSPVLAGSFFGNIAASLPSLEKLSLRSCHDDDGRAAAALLAGLPRFTRLQFLDLSLCPWLDDELLEYALPLLPLTEATIVGTSVFRRRVPRAGAK